MPSGPGRGGREPAHSLRGCERVVSGPRGAGSPSARSARKSAGGTGTGPRCGGRLLAGPSGGRSLAGSSGHARTRNCRWLGPRWLGPRRLRTGGAAGADAAGATGVAGAAGAGGAAAVGAVGAVAAGTSTGTRPQPGRMVPAPRQPSWLPLSWLAPS